eukprot:GHVU01135209.1.p1 GENE.GHVU01135209.1~~GHVU01135209.1.p1  ORF type:complete len:126 (+),score=8.86 GHVU01135209.1:116-493(+)
MMTGLGSDSREGLPAPYVLRYSEASNNIWFELLGNTVSSHALRASSMLARQQLPCRRKVSRSKRQDMSQPAPLEASNWECTATLFSSSKMLGHHGICAGRNFLCTTQKIGTEIRQYVRLLPRIAS